MKTSRVNAVVRCFLAVAVVAGAGLGILACDDSGTDSTQSAGDSSQGGPEFLARAREEVKNLYEGTYRAPTPSGPVPAKSKHLWAITIGLNSLSAANSAQAMKEAASKLGWKVTVWDGKFDPDQWLAGIRQAVLADADGIWLYAIDCPSVKAALESAKRAHIPVVLAQAADCGSGEKALATHVEGYSGAFEEGSVTAKPSPFTNFSRSWGAPGAWWLIANTDAKVKVIEIYEDDFQATLLNQQGFDEVMKLCTTCEVVDRVTFTGSQIGPTLQQKTQQALLQHPEATAVYGNYDTGVTGGIAAAVRASGRELMLIGGEGFPANMELVREGVQSAGTGYDAAWEGWAGVDDFVRIFAHQKPRVSSGLGVTLYDREHNLPPSGQGFETKVPYQQAYLKAWHLSD
jgi:ribose transport system substrate-binding protein